jgi:dihydrodipicolinate synthase/N-acetylneuraminate lyase
MRLQFRGIFAIPPTPFNERRALDLDGLGNLIDFCVASGAHGIVLPVNASEYTTLSDEERMKVVETAAKRNDGRLPLVAGVAAINDIVAAKFASHAAECGADALIAMPPYLVKAEPDDIIRYYEAISEAADLPIFIQNYIPPVGTPMDAKTLIRILREVKNARYIKEETQYAGHVITRINELTKELPSNKFLGVMGGKAGRYIIDEYERGACGNMPACEVADVQASIWNALEAGKYQEAVDMYNRIITLLNLEYLYGSALYKEVLKRRGVIRCAVSRSYDSVKLDSFDMKELDRIMDYIKPMFKL